MYIDADQCRRLLADPDVLLAMRVAAASVVGYQFADDAVHDAFLALFSTFRRSPRHIETPTAYFATAARNMARRYRYGSADGDPDEMAAPGVETTNAELGIALDRCIRKLSRERQVVVYLHYLAGFTVSQIAELLGAPEGTVRRRINDARPLLRQCLSKEGWL